MKHSSICVCPVFGLRPHKVGKVRSTLLWELYGGYKIASRKTHLEICWISHAFRLCWNLVCWCIMGPGVQWQ